MRRKRASVYSFAEDDVPPSDDPRWAGWSQLVASRLPVPLTSQELLDACPEFSYALLTNILAWMDMRHLVRKSRQGALLYWEACDSPPPEPLPAHCFVCGGSWMPRQAGVVCAMCGRTPEESSRHRWSRA